MSNLESSLPRSYVVSTVAIAVLSTASSLLGLFRPGHYGEDPVLLEHYLAEDLAILLIGVPVLLGGLWYARAGSLRGRIVWLGALAYMAYMWVSTGLAAPFNEFFLGYVVLFSLSLFTLVGGLVTTDAEAVSRELEGSVSRTLYGGALVLIALALAALWLGDLLPPTLAGETPTLIEEIGETATVSHFIDLSVVVPALALAGLWLYRGRTWGYVVAGVLLVMGAVLAPTLTAITIAQIYWGSITVPGFAVVLTIVPAVVVFVFAATYVRELSGASADPAGGTGQPT